jgi:hypothetical protein
MARLFLAGGVALLAAALFSRLPLTTWNQLLLKDDWTELFQQAANGVHLLRRGSVVGWNWWMQGGYPTSTDIAQNLSSVGFIPMTLFGDRIGYHVLHACMFFALPLMVWRDLRDEDRETATLAAGFAAVFTAGYMVTLGNSGDTNSLTGVFCAALAMLGSRAARQGRRWGGPAMVLGLTLCLYTHAAFLVYAGILLTLEAIYFRDRRAFIRLVLAGSPPYRGLPVHWESLRYPAYVSFNNTVYDPSRRRTGASRFAPSTTTPRSSRSRTAGSTTTAACATSGFRSSPSPPSRSAERARASTPPPRCWRRSFAIQHLGGRRDLRSHPAHAAGAGGAGAGGAVFRFAGTRQLDSRSSAVIACYVATSFVPIRHVPELRDFDPPFIDRVTARRHRRRRQPCRRRDRPASRHGRGPRPSNAEDTVRRPLRRRAAGDSRAALLQPDDRRLGLEHLARTGRRGRHLSRPADRRHARAGVRRRDAALGRARPVRMDRRVARVSRRQRPVRRALARRPVVPLRVDRCGPRAVVVQGGTGELRNLDFLGGDVDVRQARAVRRWSCGPTSIRRGARRLADATCRCSTAAASWHSRRRGW